MALIIHPVTGNGNAAMDASAAATLVPAAQWADPAFRERFEALYRQLHAIAHRELGRAARGTLDTGALLHEAFLKLDGTQLDSSSRGPFLALAARTMRCVLVDHARARAAAKRGGGQARVTLATDLPLESPQPGIDVLDVERGLQALQALEPRLATVVEYRFYAGMEFAEIAEQLGVSESTALRDWRKARAFLASHLGRAR